VVLHHERLDVQHDFGDVFEHAFHRGEFMLSVMDLDLRDGASLETREEDPPQPVAHRRAEAPLEWLGNKLAVGPRQRRRVADHLTGQFKSTPSNMHRLSPPSLCVLAACKAANARRSPARRSA
jgi:hypothetical protein